MSAFGQSSVNTRSTGSPSEAPKQTGFSSLRARRPDHASLLECLTCGGRDGGAVLDCHPFGSIQRPQRRDVTSSTLMIPFRLTRHGNDPYC
jgi:hypothetical protein